MYPLNIPETPPELLKEMAEQEEDWAKNIQACSIDNSECESCQ